MDLPYAIVDVFARGPLTGNALAVFYEGTGGLDDATMQRIAREMNLSETTFVEEVAGDRYRMRIFTPASELAFAGHPTLGTAWLLNHRGLLPGARAIQHTAAGETSISIALDAVWFERGGTVGPDIADLEAVAGAIGVGTGAIGFDAATLGQERAHLMPATANIGIEQLMVPLASLDALASVRPSPAVVDIAPEGVYCFAAVAPGKVKARFFAAGLGVDEDPATGSAAGSLGLYLGDRAGDLMFEIDQGENLGRPSTLLVESARGRVRVGGAVLLVADAVLHL